MIAWLYFYAMRLCTIDLTAGVFSFEKNSIEKLMKNVYVSKCDTVGG